MAGYSAGKPLRHILNRKMKLFGEVNGEVTFSFHMDHYTVEEFVF